jgi:DNA-binding CsgD family transcriptional regulator/tetratricopeptide (TPR) repeat protein
MELLERTAFLRTLAEYAAEARLGDGRLVLVSGESGMGKTALVEEFQQRLKGARWLWGACDGLLTPRPLGPVFDVGAQVGGELAGLCRRQGAQRDRLFAAFQTEIDSPGALTVAVVEDVHWADEATVDLLSFLGKRLGRMSTLLLATYRDDELGDDHPLRVVLGDLATQRATRRMRLPPLSQEAVRALAAGRDVDGGELYRITSGNPFYVSEILEAGWPSVPPTVRDAVGARLARSGPQTRRVVESAAVIGTRVDRSLLSTVLDGAPVEDSLTAGILVADGTDLRFRHELVRMAVAAAIAPHRKIELHARLLTELEERGDADPAVLAHHAEGAGDEKAVLRHAPEAARRSSALGAHREAAAQFERALRFADGLDKPALAALQEGLAGEYALLDRWEESERALRAALALRRELGHSLNVAKDLRLLSGTLWRLCRGQEADRAAEQAVRVLEALPPGPELAWAYASLAARIFESGRTDEGLRFMEKARDLGERQQRADIVSYALNGIGLGLMESGRDGIAVLKRALQLGLDADLHEAAGRAYSSLQEACTRLNRFADSERYHAEGMAYCEGRELGVFSLCLMGWRARTLILAGRWDEATEVCAQLLGRRGISPVNQINPLQVLGTIRGCRGEDGAWELLDQALALAEGTGDRLWIAPVRAARAELRWLWGDSGLAAREVSAGYDQAAGCAEPWTFGSLVIWLFRLRVPVPAELPAGLPEPYAREMAGDWAGAAAAWLRLGRPYDAALARLGCADETALRHALAAFDALGARAAAAAARRRMKDLGMRAIPRGPRAATRAAPAGLTAREQQVLALLAEGLPDREIARRLFISERTVHHHVSAVLAKTGVASRTAAAREAARMGIDAPAGAPRRS